MSHGERTPEGISTPDEMITPLSDLHTLRTLHQGGGHIVTFPGEHTPAEVLRQYNSGEVLRATPSDILARRAVKESMEADNA